MIIIIRALSQWGKDDGDYDSPKSRHETPDEKREAKEAQIKKRGHKKREGPNKKNKKIMREKEKRDNATILLPHLCRIPGSGRPLRFEHWGAHRGLSPTDLHPISSCDFSWKQRTPQGTQGLYWFRPPLWCNTLLQCVVWSIASGADEDQYKRRTASWEVFLSWCDELLGWVQSPLPLSLLGFYQISRCLLPRWPSLLGGG